MGYVGQSVSIPLGEQGLLTDLPETKIPATALTEARNISFELGGITKDTGSVKFNATALDSGAKIIGLWDWHPDGSNQRTIAITATGKVFRDTGDGTFSSGSAIDTSFNSPTLDLTFTEGGNEDASQNKKLFIYTATRALSYIDGDAASITSATAAADWGSGNHPTGGFILQDKHVVFGNANFAHQLYISAGSDHTVFNTGIDTLAVFPGEGDAIVAGFVFRGVALIFKRPWGVYAINTNNSGTVSDWSVQRLDRAFGLASPNSLVQVTGDLLAANFNGSITSLTAAEQAGDLEYGDILSNAEIENYVRTNFKKSGISETQVMYYEEKKRVYFTGTLDNSGSDKAMLTIDLNKPQVPRWSVTDKDKPTVLAMQRDDDGIRRPIYGDAAGFVYQMDQGVQSVDGNAYTGEFQTPEIDFSFLDPSLSFKTKLFDFLTLNIVGSSSQPIFADVYLDGTWSQSISFAQVSGVLLGTFLLGTDSLSELRPKSLRKRIKGAGKRIQVRFYTSGIDTFRIQSMTFDFRLGNEGAEK